MSKLDWDSFNKLDREFYQFGLTPIIGVAETKQGEAIRACIRMSYRFFNDGTPFWDNKYKDSGCAGFNYLKSKDLTSDCGRACYDYSEDYRYGIYTQNNMKVMMNIYNNVLEYVKNSKGVYQKNYEDFLDYDNDVVEEYDEDEEW